MVGQLSVWPMYSLASPIYVFFFFRMRCPFSHRCLQFCFSHAFPFFHYDAGVVLREYSPYLFRLKPIVIKAFEPFQFEMNGRHHHHTFSVVCSRLCGLLTSSITATPSLPIAHMATLFSSREFTINFTHGCDCLHRSGICEVRLLFADALDRDRLIAVNNSA